MKVEIWSDIMCPFCYIGKRKFEKALSLFRERNSVEIEWKSYQLMPDIETVENTDIYTLLSEKKGISVEQAKSMNQQVTDVASAVGLQFNMDKAIPANTLLAHRFLHYSKQCGKQNEAEELLFQAYFTDGKNVDSIEVLGAIGEDIGLDRDKIAAILASDQFREDVQRDIYEAQQVGVRGVPFFVIDQKYAVSGAQEPEVFLNALQMAKAEN
ncbi:MAG: DsbA family oxidoreductase [Sphingobacteriales bacterium]|nr:MAG: DsbA family oxidoreductase [Sphingobacteriales bacterium]